MKTFHCNEREVSLTKMAVISGHKLTNIHKGSAKFLMCKLDNVSMSCKEARELLLSKYQFINSQGEIVK